MKRYRRSPQVLSRAFAGEALLTFPGGDGFESLKGPGYAVWVLLEEPRTSEELVSELAQIFEEEEGTIGSDVEGFLHSLVQRRLIEEVG